MYVEDDENEEDEDDEDQMTMFERRATVYAQNEGELSWKHVAMGNLRVLYDSSFFGVKIVVESDNNELASETVVSVDSTIQRNEKECTWTEEMYQTFQEGLECATKADIRE